MKRSQLCFHCEYSTFPSQRATIKNSLSFFGILENTIIWQLESLEESLLTLFGSKSCVKNCNFVRNCKDKYKGCGSTLAKCLEQFFFSWEWSWRAWVHFIVILGLYDAHILICLSRTLFHYKNGQEAAAIKYSFYLLCKMPWWGAKKR